MKEAHEAWLDNNFGPSVATQRANAQKNYASAIANAEGDPRRIEYLQICTSGTCNKSIIEKIIRDLGNNKRERLLLLSSLIAERENDEKKPTFSDISTSVVLC